MDISYLIFQLEDTRKALLSTVLSLHAAEWHKETFISCTDKDCVAARAVLGIEESK